MSKMQSCHYILSVINLLAMSCLFASCSILSRDNGSKLWPEKYPFLSNGYVNSTSRGFIVRKNKDTLHGYVRMKTNYYSGERLGEVLILPDGKTQKQDI